MSYQLSLYEQLSEANRKTLHAEADRFPNLTSSLIEQLKKYRFSVDLPITNAFNVHNIIFGMTPFDITEYYDLFK
jgi:hypothetical protein